MGERTLQHAGFTMQIGSSQMKTSTHRFEKTYSSLNTLLKKSNRYSAETLNQIWQSVICEVRDAFIDACPFFLPYVSADWQNQMQLKVKKNHTPHSCWQWSWKWTIDAPTSIVLFNFHSWEAAVNSAFGWNHNSNHRISRLRFTEDLHLVYLILIQLFSLYIIAIKRKLSTKYTIIIIIVNILQEWKKCFMAVVN